MARSRINPLEFGELLRRARHAAGMTQEELAERAGVSARGISDLERGARRTPQRTTLDLLADALDVPDTERSTWKRARQVSARRTMPAVAVAPRPPPSAARLPHPPSSLIGRQRETQDVVTLLRDLCVRLVTLTGPGGVGKTRLALAVAEQVQEDFRDGVVYVSLQSHTKPELLPAAIAQALNVREVGNQALVERLVEVLRDKQLLLILDNFEHLLPAAPLVSDLLVACPNLTILVTSRVVLHLYGEYDYFLPPLALPDSIHDLQPEQAQVYEAVQLFIVRGQAANASFNLTSENASTVAAICTRLDGLPLAIELAAARLRMFPPQELLTRLEHPLAVLTNGPLDVPARQQALRATLAWSSSLLSENEQRLFRQLAIFRGGWTLEAAEAVCDPDLNVFGGLSTLVDHSLVTQHEQPDGTARFSMLETIHDFAQERLEQDSDPHAKHAQHAEYFTQLAEQARMALQAGSDQQYWLMCLESEIANLRAAFDWTVSRDDVETARRLAVSLEEFWYAHGYGSEGRRWLKLVLESADSIPVGVRANLNKALGKLAGDCGDYQEAETFLERAISLYRDADDPMGLASAYEAAGDTAQYQGEFERARRQYQQGLDIARAARFPRGIAGGLAGLSIVEWVEGNNRQAETFASECLQVALENDDQISITMAHTFLGYIALAQGEPDTAARWAEEGIACARELGDFGYLALGLELLGDIELERENYPEAQEHLQESLRGFWAAGEMMPIAHSLEGLASVASGLGSYVRSAQLLGASAVLRKRIGSPMRPPLLGTYDRTVAAARMALDEESFRLAEDEGRSWSLERAVDCALQPLDIPKAGLATDAMRLLTPRELEVLRLLIEGCSNQEIATELFISPHTAISHVANIMNKLDVESRTAAATWGIRQGIA